MVILTICSCQNQKQSTSSSNDLISINESKKKIEFHKNPIIYLSGGNDMANIKLTLAPDRTFEFVLQHKVMSRTSAGTIQYIVVQYVTVMS